MSMVNIALPIKKTTCKCGRMLVLANNYTCPDCSKWGDKIEDGKMYEINIFTGWCDG